ncbi:MAG TPA: SigE family RNA polymerase sigma factor [Streptosporangiaceae bacterium]|nr:SigE family RNA polymerase sigma factor [Streptosporangiaceae bacterium]
MDDGARRDFADFVAARSAELLRLAYLLTGDQHSAEDLLQAALTQAAAHWGRIHSAPEGYVRRILYREQINRWRRNARRRETAMAQIPELATQDPTAGADTRVALRGALLALPPGKRAVLVLRYLEDLPEAQVAEILGCSVGTVRSQTHKAIAQLRSVLPTLGLTSTEAHR